MGVRSKTIALCFLSAALDAGAFAQAPGAAEKLDKLGLEGDANAFEVGRAVQLLESLAGAIKARKPSEDATWVDAFNARDDAGADNLHWLVTERYTDQRVIVWCASMHMLRDLGSIDTLSASLNYDGVRSMGQPCKQSSMQHIVNQRAMATWDRDGFEAALRWAVDRLESDPGFLYFYPAPWRSRLDGDEARLDALAEAIAGGYERRIEAEPQAAGRLGALRDASLDAIRR